MTLEETLARAEKSLFTIWHAFHGEIVSVGPRTQPVLAYVGLGLEHVDSIIILMKHGNAGSALALYRPVIEIFWRGSWTAACATDEQVQAMRKDDFRFPDSVTLVKNWTRRSARMSFSMDCISKRGRPSTAMRTQECFNLPADIAKAN